MSELRAKGYTLQKLAEKYGLSRSGVAADSQEGEMKNERTGKKTAAIAGRLLTALQGATRRDKICVWIDREGLTVHLDGLCTAAELKAVLASALTQAPDVKKPTKRAAKRA